MAFIWGNIDQNVMVWVNFVNKFEGFSRNERSLGCNVEHIFVQEEYAEREIHDCMINKKNVQSDCYSDPRRVFKNEGAVSEFCYVEALMKLVQMLLHEKAFVMLYRKYCRCHRKTSMLGREFR